MTGKILITFILTILAFTCANEFNFIQHDLFNPIRFHQEQIPGLKCSYKEMTNLYNEYMQAINEFRHHGKFEGKEWTEVFQNVSEKLTSFIGNFVGCLVKMGVSVVIRPTEREWKTKFCYSMNLTDPCCNVLLQDMQCCAPRLQRVPGNEVTKFNEIFLASCRNKDKIKSVITDFLEKFEMKRQACQSSLLRGIYAYADNLSKMTQCFVDVYVDGKDCDEHSDCYSGVCNVLTKKCALRSLSDDSEAIVKCITSNLPQNVVKFLKKKFSLPGSSSDDELKKKLNEALISHGCLNEYNQHDQSKETQSSCEEPEICNDGYSASFCSTGFFCGQLLGNEIYKPTSPLWGLNTKEKCESFGFCLGRGMDVVVDRETCESNFTCTNPECKFGECDQATCESTGMCLGYPFSSGVCITPFEVDELLGKHCPSGTTQTIIGCRSISGNNKNDCENKPGFKWVEVPKTKEECEQYKRCREGYVFSSKNAEECSKCNGNLENMFRWVPYKWVQAVFVSPFHWVERKVVSRNRWVPILRQAELVKLANGLLTFQLLPAFATFLGCALGPQMSLLKAFACDCGDDKGSNCFENLETRIADIIAFSGLKQVEDLPEFKIEISEDTISKTDDNINLSINQIPSLKEITESTTQFSHGAQLYQSSSKSVAYIKSGRKIVGQLVTDGIRINTEGKDLQDSVKLCIKRDQNVPVTDPSFTVACFATEKSPGQYVATNMDAINENTDTEICAYVKDDTVYYGALIQVGAPRDAGTMARASIFVLIICLIISFF